MSEAANAAGKKPRLLIVAGPNGAGKANAVAGRTLLGSANHQVRDTY